MAPTIRVNSPPHMGFLFFSWFHRGWRVLLQLPAVGLGELDVTPLVGNGTELSELFDLSLGCETFMKTPWFRWCERKAVRFTELFGYEKHPFRTGSDFGAINRWMSMFITEKGLILMKIGFLQLHKWSSETLRNGHFNHRIRNKVSFVTQHIHNGEKNSNNDSFGDVGLPNLYLGTTPPPSNLSRESQPKPSWWWLDSWVVGRPNLYPKRTQFIQKELAMEPRICLIRGDFVLVNVSLALQSPEKIHAEHMGMGRRVFFICATRWRTAPSKASSPI